MTSASESTVPAQRSPGFAISTSAPAVAIGGLALLGWVAGIASLRGFGGDKPMNPVTGIALAGAGTALWLLRRATSRQRRVVGRVLAAAVGIAGLLKSLEYAFGWSIGIDGWLFAQAIETAGGLPVAGMSQTTASSLVLMSVGLLSLESQFRGWRPADFLALACLGVALPTLVGHLAGVIDLPSTSARVPMALNSAIALITLSIGVIGARSELGLLGQLRKESSLRSQVGVGLGVAGCVLVLVGAVGMWGSVRSEEAARERRALFDRRNQMEQLMGTMLDAETGQRGFLLTGDSAFLAPYEKVASTVPAQLAAIRKGFEPYPDRSEQLSQLDSLVQSRMGELGRTIGLGSAGQTAQALVIVRQGGGLRTMDQIRDIASSMMAEEQRLLTVWDRRIQVADRVTLITAGAGTLLTVAFLLVSMGAISRNIVTRENAQAALRESEQRIFRLLEALPVAVFVVDARGKTYYTNPASLAILGKPRDPDAAAGDLAETYDAYVAGTDRIYPGDRTPIVRAMAGERVHVEDIELHRPDGVVPLEVRAAPILDSSGQIQYAVAVFSDVSERQKSQHAIRELNQQLKLRVGELTDLNAELEAFAYSVSHDLRAPVRHIDGFARILEEELGPSADSQLLHYLGRIRDGSTQMGILIDELLRLSRLSRQELKLQHTDLNELVRRVIERIKEEAGGREIEWRVGQLSEVYCDPGLMNVVLVNLLANAVKYTRQRPLAIIEVAEVPVNGERTILVRDNGVGFEMQYADKLFGVFQRLHRAGEFEGTGVGLAIVHRLIRKHGGRIWAQAEPDKGASFYFTLGPSAGA